MSQYAVFITCQMPDRSGLPSPVRGMRLCASAERERHATAISAKTVRVTAIRGDYTTRAGGVPMKSGSVLAILALVLIAVPAAAHHSFAAEFDSNKPV